VPAGDLAELRAEVARTDAQIVEATVRRLELVRRIGRLKAREHLPLRDYPLEAEVVARWVRGLGPGGVPAERAEALVRWFLEESVAAQEAFAAPESGAGRGRETVIVGGLGQMGRWLAEFLATAGCRIAVVDTRDAPERYPYEVHRNLARAAADAEFVVVATPMRRTPSVYRELLGTETEATIFDILSVKAPIVPWIRRGIERGYHLASAHPLFGPGTRSIFGRNLLVLDCGDPPASASVERLFSGSSLRVRRLPLEAHDRLMADVLGLPHLVALVFARALEAGGASPEALGEAASTSFRRIAEVARLVTRENPELVADIQLLNPSSAAVLDRLDVAVAELRKVLGAGRPQSYAATLDKGRHFLERTGL
jgi:chorismate mutase / prephenate dehydrogenase